jgi:CRP-like cAMP-binding protein
MSERAELHEVTRKVDLVSDFLDTKRKEIDGRLRELKPLIDEYRQLEAAQVALAGLLSAARSSGRRGRGGRAAAPSSTPRRRGRPRGTGTRALQALELIKARPAITTAEIADAMGIKQNYLYRVLPGLERDGKIAKRGRGWFAA